MATHKYHNTNNKRILKFLKIRCNEMNCRWFIFNIRDGKFLNAPKDLYEK